MMRFNKEAIENEMLISLAECVSEFNGDASLDDDYALLERIIVRVRYLLNHKNIPYRDYRD